MTALDGCEVRLRLCCSGVGVGVGAGVPEPSPPSVWTGGSVLPLLWEPPPHPPSSRPEVVRTSAIPCTLSRVLQRDTSNIVITPSVKKWAVEIEFLATNIETGWRRSLRASSQFREAENAGGQAGMEFTAGTR